MELLKAFERMSKLDSDVKKLDEWVAHLQFNNKPVTGREWVRLRKAIEGVIGDLAEERNELEDKLTVATVGIEINHK